MPTIADIATGDDRFDVLVSTLKYVDTALPGSNLVATLASAETDVTVFAPTDTAFGRLAADLGFAGDTSDEGAVTAYLVGALDAVTIRDVILYHVSGGAKTLAEVAALPEVPTLNGATFAPDGVTLVDREPDLIDPSLVQTDVKADNGIVHVIDRVLLPADLPGNDAPTITGIVAASGSYDSNSADFDILLNAVLAAGLESALDNPEADLTAFAPNDAAFMAAASALGYAGSSESGAFSYLVESLTLLSGGQDPIPLLTDILLYHVAPESLQASQVLSAESIPTLLGVSLGVSGTNLVDAEPDLPDPGIIATDTQAANGVVHVIDGVLIPVDLLQSGDGSNSVDFIVDGSVASTINTGRDNDLIDGNGGNDRINAGAGDDLVLGGIGRDTIFGGNGNDSLRGEAGVDVIFGGAGDDLIDGGKGNDLLRSGIGSDVFVFATGSQRDTVDDFDNGMDRLDVSAYGFTGFEQIEALVGGRVGHDFVLIRLGEGDTITLNVLARADLDASDFIFATSEPTLS